MLLPEGPIQPVTPPPPSGLTPDQVKAMQARLNTVLVPSPRLTVDGVMGPGTKNAILRFQQQAWLVEDGKPGPATMLALFDREQFRPILRTDVPFVQQPSNSTNWAAATAMMSRSTVPAVIARTPKDLIAPDGSLVNWTTKSVADANAARFAQAHHLRIHPKISWSDNAPAFRKALATSPLMFDTLWPVAGQGNQGHILVVGIRGEGARDTITFRYHLPGGTGPFSQWYPTSFYRVHSKLRWVFVRG